MRKLRIYVDTSVIGGCFDSEFQVHSRALWGCFETGEHVLLLSSHTQRELEQAPERVRTILKRIPSVFIEAVDLSPEVQALAQAYLRQRAIPSRSPADALHLALATVHRADVIVSWNFRDIVNLGTIRKVNSVNMAKGYAQIEIRSPREVVSHGRG